MFSNEYAFAMSTIRSAQEKANASFQTFIVSNPELYSYQITKIFMLSDSYGLKKSTKYLTKKLVDKYLMIYKESTLESNWEFLMISFFRFATKFNQTSYMSQGFTLDQCVRLCGQRFSKEQFHQFEDSIVHDPRFLNLMFCSPYDYFETFRQAFALFPKSQARILLILDFCLTIPQFMNRSAQQLFFGSLWTLKLTKEESFQLNENIIKAQTKNWNQAKELGQILKIYYQAQINAAFQQEDTECDSQ